jgi:WD40 repeat protein
MKDRTSASSVELFSTHPTPTRTPFSVVCADCSPPNMTSLLPKRFVVGTDSGGVLKCALQDGGASRLTTASGGELCESSPVTLPFGAHGGPVYAVACSPFHRNFFLTASTDGTVRLYSHLDTKSAFFRVFSSGPSLFFMRVLRGYVLANRTAASASFNVA